MYLKNGKKTNGMEKISIFSNTLKKMTINNHNQSICHFPIYIKVCWAISRASSMWVLIWNRKVFPRDIHSTLHLSYQRHEWKANPTRWEKVETALQSIPRDISTTKGRSHKMTAKYERKKPKIITISRGRKQLKIYHTSR